MTTSKKVNDELKELVSKEFDNAMATVIKQVNKTIKSNGVQVHFKAACAAEIGVASDDDDEVEISTIYASNENSGFTAVSIGLDVLKEKIINAETPDNIVALFDMFGGDVKDTVTTLRNLHTAASALGMLIDDVLADAEIPFRLYEKESPAEAIELAVKVERISAKFKELLDLPTTTTTLQ